ncbi:MAG: glycosyltransferase family 4 protein [Chryseolinea sp.]
MKILILHQHFNTPQKGGAIRSYYLAKALVDKGIEIVVISGHNEKDYKRENIEGIDVHFLPIAYDNRFGFWKRSFSFVHYILGSVKLARQFRDISICYAISVPLTIGLAARWMKLRYKIPYIFEVGDLWPDAPIQMGFIENYFFKQFLYQLESSIYRDAESIVALSPMIKAAIEKKVKNKTIHLIPNMADIDFYKPEIKSPTVERKFGMEGKFVVSYIGAAGVANGLDYFLECARASLRRGQNIHFLICGDGAVLARLKDVAQRSNLSNLTFLDFQNREGVREIMSITDAAFVCYKSVPILETGSPNKYFDGLAAGKLIIANFGGWIKEEIESNQCGIYVHPNQPTDFANKIELFLNNKEYLLKYQQASRILAESNYARKKLSERFVNIF